MLRIVRKVAWMCEYIHLEVDSLPLGIQLWSLFPKSLWQSSDSMLYFRKLAEYVQALHRCNCSLRLHFLLDTYKDLDWQQDVHYESSILKMVHLLRIWCVATWENLAHKAAHQASEQYLWYMQYTKDICCKKGSGLFHVTCVIERSTPNFNVKCPDVDRFSIL